MRFLSTLLVVISFFVGLQLNAQVEPDTIKNNGNFTLELNKDTSSAIRRNNPTDEVKPKKEKVNKKASRQSMMGFGASYYDLNRKIMVRCGAGFLQMYDHSNQDYTRSTKNLKFMPIGLDYGASDAFTLGATLFLDKNTSDQAFYDKQDSIGKFETAKESTVFLGFNVKYYFKVNSFTFRPYAEVGISYIRILSDVTPSRDDGNGGYVVTDQDTPYTNDELFFDFIGRVGVDFYPLERVGCGLSVGYDNTLVALNVIFKL
ncbi:MAG: hypothetical protein KKA07_05945 [Bacteroidetes bacterium]|nr:hypothetical protein [Bacteroidota bacterium]MBU1718597.1 hypothetical protein [Bacteroidota bacterium]